MNSPFFSVIIPVYNRSEILPKAVASVFSQTFSNWELLIVDDGSDDDPEIALKEYLKDERVRLYKTPNRGVSAARNLAAREARGDWLAFLDSDDQWLEHKLKTQRSEILKSPELLFHHSEEIWFRNGKRVNPKKKHKKGGGKQFIPSLRQCVISPTTSVIEKDFFWSLEGFREDFPVCEDYDLWLKITCAHQVGFIDEPLAMKFGGARDQLSLKFRGMDFWRATSILWILENRKISTEEKKVAFEVLSNQLDVLNTGLTKKNMARELEGLRGLRNRFDKLKRAE